MKFVPKTVSRSIGRQILVAKRNSPHIFFGLGLAGVIGSTVLACRATLKLEENLDEIQTDFQNVTNMSGYDEVGKLRYSETQYRKDVSYVYMKGGVKLAKLYGPSVVIGGLSIAALTGAHVQLTKRNAALGATLGAVMKAYEQYRLRIQEEIGEDREREIYYDIQDKTVIGEDGKKQVIKTANPTKYSVYAKIFDEWNPEWKNDPEYNRIFLQHQQSYAQHQLQTKGYLLLNDVYDALGFDKTKAGCVVGWTLDGEGDGYVSFGLFENSSSRFINNIESSIILDFNVDGVIYHKLKDH